MRRFPARCSRAALAVWLAIVASGAMAAPSRADMPASFPDAVFSDDFESGSLGNWDQSLGTGTRSVSPEGAHAGAYGLRFANSIGDTSLVTKVLPGALTESATSFWMRTSASTGIFTVAQARDAGSSSTLWVLLYDAGARAFYLYPFKSTGAVELYTGANSAPGPNTWMQVEVRYDAATDGGAQLYINGQTQASWGASGDFSQDADYAILQLWNDGSDTVDFDDVTVARPAPGPRLPGPPTGVHGSSADRSVALAWTAPVSDGGSPITAYRITPYVDGVPQAPVTTSSAGTTWTVTGLTDGTDYTFTVAAINGVGAGKESAPSPAYRPRATTTAPVAPKALEGSAADGAVALDWHAPSDDGGSPVTSYRVTPYLGDQAQTPIDTGSTDPNYTVTGLSNGTAYSFTVAAVNAIGVGDASARSIALTPAQTQYPDAVFSTGFESGAMTAFDRALGTGDASMTATAARQGAYGLRLANASGQYALVSKTFDAPVADSSTRFAMRTSATSGMINVADARDAGSSLHMWVLFYDASTHGFYFYAYKDSSSIGVYTGANSVPGPNAWIDIEVRYDAAVHGSAQLYVNGQTQPSWGASGDFHRDSDYSVLQLWNDGGGDTVDFDDVAVTGRPQIPTVPDAPTGVTAAQGDGQTVTVDWTAPEYDGDSPLTGYRITPYIDGVAQTPATESSTATEATLDGLSPGTDYTFTVAATNAIGTGPESGASAPVAPRTQITVPAAPAAPTGTAGDGSVALAWTAPDSGGSRITSYRLTPYAAGSPQTPIDIGSSATHYTASGLTNGTAYTFTVAAVNALGTGPESAQSSRLTPAPPTPPGAPLHLSGAVGDGTVKLSWAAPAGDGGKPVTGYRITPYVGGTPQSAVATGSTSTTYTFSGLTNGTAYTFTVAAVNAVGAGDESAPTVTLTPVARKVVVSIEFDDNPETQWQTLPILQAHGMNATFYVNSGLTPDAPGWRMSWSQLSQLAAAGNEITGHTLDHPDLTTLSTADQQHEICDDRANIQSHGLGQVLDLAYPYGAYAQNNVTSMVKQCGYYTGRTVGGLRSSTCPDCPFAETLPPADPLVTRTPGDVRDTDTLATVEQYVTQAEDNGGGWVQLVFHHICDNDCDEYSATPELFSQLLDWLQPRAANGTIVQTVEQAIRGA